MTTFALCKRGNGHPWQKILGKDWGKMKKKVLKIGKGGKNWKKEKKKKKKKGKGKVRKKSKKFFHFAPADR